MDIKKFAPWNWFKEEERAETRNLPVAAQAGNGYESQLPSQLMKLHNDLDRMFERAWSDLGLPLMAGMPGLSDQLQSPMLLKPSVDVSAADDEYIITVEVPGVEEDDIKLELADDTLTIKGTKQQESSNKDKDYVRVERAYGAFQRVLSLPEDANREEIDARFHNGILTITMPRKAVAKPRGKLIDIKSAA